MRRTKLRTTETPGEIWSVAALMVLVVLPTLAVLWFVNIAIRNERLANQQRFSQVYRAHLNACCQQLRLLWEQRIQEVEQILRDCDGAAAFGEIVHRKLGDAVVLYDQSGTTVYPQAFPRASEVVAKDVRWTQANAVEFAEQDLPRAIEIYRTLAQESRSIDEQALAWQAVVRCLMKQGQTEDALAVVQGPLHEPALQPARDAYGRLIVPSVDLLVLEHLNAEPSERRQECVERLMAWLDDYETVAMPSHQRRFLASRLQRQPSQPVYWGQLAEDLAARYVEADPPSVREAVLHRSPLVDIWRLRSGDGQAVLLFRDTSLRRWTQETLAQANESGDFQTQLLAPGQSTIEGDFPAVDLGADMPGWRLTVRPMDTQLSPQRLTYQTTIYLVIGLTVIVSTSIIALIVARAFRRQLRLARLRNDLVGTVSHELRTPLASMRVLVDSLLENDNVDERQTREYLQLVARENARLSRLIENFLTFSRLERGKHSFEFTSVDPAALVERAVDAAGPRFKFPADRLSVTVDENLPRLDGDIDALTIVLLNLLDNAYKYSNPESTISLRVNRDGGDICFHVADHGVGISRSSAKRIFQKFYQVDRRLNRDVEGCGLGLSIAKSIVDAHEGSLSVSSEIGRGSIFTVRLPSRKSLETLPLEAGG